RRVTLVQVCCGQLKNPRECLCEFPITSYMCVHLKKPSGADLWIEELENTKYNGDDDEVNAWGKFYLPEIVKMQVIGVVKGTSCPCDELVLMTCEDKKLYGYDGEELHLVASSFLELCDKTIEYPASKRYYNGENYLTMSSTQEKGLRLGRLGKISSGEKGMLLILPRNNML
uniref:Uncharacterized protein n=1 Tax=Maylandia zebra TaxID=106582 RepID=A0A3P9DF72_9CICH